MYGLLELCKHSCFVTSKRVVLLFWSRCAVIITLNSANTNFLKIRKSLGISHVCEGSAESLHTQLHQSMLSLQLAKEHKFFGCRRMTESFDMFQARSPPYEPSRS
jgi:hypothetical protein